MNEESSFGTSDVQDTVARQAREIEQLRGQLANQRFAEDLRAALAVPAMAGIIASPVAHSRLVELIVETAAGIISAREAALFLIEEGSQELVVAVASGETAEAIKKIRVPLGHGVAGLVAVSGQPIAIADAQRDPRHAADIAHSVGYLPQSILCVPLIYNEQTIGVLELLDKVGGETFSTADMQALGLFANLAAVAIEQSLTHGGLVALMGEALTSLTPRSDVQRQDLQQRSQGFVEQLEDDPIFRRAIDLARLVQQIVWQGENEATVCRIILSGFAEYLRSRPAQPDYFRTNW